MFAQSAARKLSLFCTRGKVSRELKFRDGHVDLLTFQFFYPLDPPDQELQISVAFSLPFICRCAWPVCKKLYVYAARSSASSPVQVRAASLPGLLPHHCLQERQVQDHRGHQQTSHQPQRSLPRYTITNSHNLTYLPASFTTYCVSQGHLHKRPVCQRVLSCVMDKYCSKPSPLCRVIKC